MSRSSGSQRIHLTATARGLVLQPLNQVFERIDAEVATRAEPTFGTALAQLAPVTGTIVTAFRIGQRTGLPSLSPRRPVEDVIVS